jgi:hypothetical protein
MDTTPCEEELIDPGKVEIDAGFELPTKSTGLSPPGFSETSVLYWGNRASHSLKQR